MSETAHNPSNAGEMPSVPPLDAAELGEAQTMPPSALAPADEAGVTAEPTPDQAARSLKASPSEPLLPHIAGYEVLAELGRGGMGVVYKARHLKLNRIVALKMILSGGHATAADLQRFQTEAEAVARLRHEGIVQVYEIGEHEGLPFFSLEFCEGGSLAAKLAGTPLPAHEAAAVVEQVARAVQAAHERQILHRDLKPANILLSGDGTPKVTDFGLAKKLDEAGQTASGAVMGTPSYMAPEQAGGKASEVGPLADQYSLGAVLYECLTGRPPFRAATALDTLMQVVSEEPVPPRQLNARVPIDLETICLKCLRKEPGLRYGSAAALAEDLKRFQGGEPVLARPVSRTERGMRWVRRNPVASALAAGVVLTLMVGTTVASVFAYQARQAQKQAEQQARDEAKAREGETRARHEAEQKEKLRKEEADRAEQLLYLSRMNLALRHWENAQVSLAREQLDACPVALRNWEHGCLRRMCQGTPFTILGDAGSVTSVCFSPDGSRLAGADNDQTVKVWDARTGRVALSLKGHTGPVTSVCFSPDRTRLASASYDKTVKVWDARTGQEALTLKGHTGPVTSVCFAPDGGRLVSASWDSTVKVWDARTGQEALTIKEDIFILTNVCFSPDGSRFASGTHRGTVKVWDARTGQEAFILRGHAGSVTSVCFSPDGSRLASGSNDQTVRVWDARTGREILALRGHTGPVTSVCFSPDGSRLASASNDQTVKVWDARTGREALTLKGHTSKILSVCFSPDGTRLASGSSDKRVKVWDGRLTENPTPTAWKEFMQPAPRWHTEQAADAEHNKQWFNAAFHLRRLLLEKPDDADLDRRRDDALKRLAIEEAARPPARMEPLHKP